MMRDGSLASHRWVHTSGPYSALNHRFAVHSTHAAVGRYLEDVFRCLASPGPPGNWYSVAEDDSPTERRWTLCFNKEEIGSASHPAALVSTLLWHVNRQAVDRSGEYLLLHAAAAEYASVAVVMPAPTESGKTTLVAGLVQRGLRYLTDEAVAIDPRTLVVHPFPKALSIDSGSWTVLSDLEPNVDPELLAHLAPQWQVDPGSIRPEAVAPPCRPGWVIVPHYEAGARTELQPLRPARAVATLCENSFNLRRHATEGLRALASVVRQSTCNRLMVGDLDTACALILALFAQYDVEAPA